MADLSRAADGYEGYFTEKLWELVPAIYRNEDGSGEQPGVVRGLIETIASQAAMLRRSQDRLWDDTFIDLCDDWAVPYIGDLVGTRLISALNQRGRRIDVAKTIYYRRRKGTPRVLEELIADITPLGRHGGRGVPAARPDPSRPRSQLPAAQLGRFSRHAARRHRRSAPAARLDADRRSVRRVRPHADVRRQRGRDGLWNIPKLLFFLYRLRAFPVVGVTPFGRAAAGTFTFDPSGPRHRPVRAAPGRAGLGGVALPVAVGTAGTDRLPASRRRRVRRHRGADPVARRRADGGRSTARRRQRSRRPARLPLFVRERAAARASPPCRRRRRCCCRR